MLMDIYERVKMSEFQPGEDHVTQVMRVQQMLVGKKPVFILNVSFVDELIVKRVLFVFAPVLSSARVFCKEQSWQALKFYHNTTYRSLVPCPLTLRWGLCFQTPIICVYYFI